MSVNQLLPSRLPSFAVEGTSRQTRLANTVVKNSAGLRRHAFTAPKFALLSVIPEEQSAGGDMCYNGYVKQ